jgi:hypothetical protein
MENKIFCLSRLKKTWIFDLDGVAFIHNNYLSGGTETIQSFMNFYDKNISEDDMVIFISSRKEKYRNQTVRALKLNSIRFNHLIMDAPFGERILVNDKKNSGLETAFSINLKRDSDDLDFYEIIFREDL